jgi:hypothetical protein
MQEKSQIITEPTPLFTTDSSVFQWFSMLLLFISGRGNFSRRSQLHADKYYERKDM